jgi:hypothetical protein
MHSSRPRILVALAMFWITVTAEAEAPRQRQYEGTAQEQGVGTSPADFCGAALEKGAAPAAVPWRARIDRRTAAYVVAHVQRACRMMAGDGSGDARFAELAEQLKPVLADLWINVLAPIYRIHPELEAAPPAGSRLQDVDPGAAARPRARRVYRATRHDIRRATAVRLRTELDRIGQQAMKLAAAHADQAATKEAAMGMLQPIADATAELSFASKVTYDAYPELFAKLFQDVPHQPRTDESDASFRKWAPPRGSVKLSAAALSFVKSFMKQARRMAPRDDQIASISWVSGQKWKGPNDVAWIDEGAGWVLGAYFRSQLPPDVIDRVGGIDIVFGAEDPSSLDGKTVDIKDRKFIVRD